MPRKMTPPPTETAAGHRGMCPSPPSVTPAGKPIVGGSVGGGVAGAVAGGEVVVVAFGNVV